MQLFAHYLHPVTNWLKIHPTYALFFTFFIAFTESLAIIGSIVPGSITMTAIGMLAGSGIMRIDLTLIAASLGAVAGDNASYSLGFFYRHRLANVWPFKNYPQLIAYGKYYFEKHGGKSIIVGRFIGPLRSIIPVIAGMMHMGRWRFFLANVISGIGWAILYVLPGVLIGSASHTLSPETATRLFIIILVSLALMWLVTAIIKRVFKQSYQWSIVALPLFWQRLMQTSIGRGLKFISPDDPKNYYRTALLTLIWLLVAGLLIVLTVLITQGYLQSIDEMSYLFLQSFRNNRLDLVAFILAQVINPFSLIAFSCVLIGLGSYYRNWQSIIFWINLIIISIITVTLLHLLIKPSNVVTSYPLACSTYAVALFTSLLFYNSYPNKSAQMIYKVVLISLLGLANLAILYLGRHWLTDVLGAILVGLVISIGHQLYYQRHNIRLKNNYLTLFALIILIVSDIILVGYNYPNLPFKTSKKYYSLSQKDWQSNLPILPLYQVNRLGKNTNLFNLQYAGSLENLEKTLAFQHWTKDQNTFFDNLLKRLTGEYAFKDTPLLRPVHINQKSILTMRSKPINKIRYLLSAWPSHYYLLPNHQPIWLITLKPIIIKSTNIRLIKPSVVNIIHLPSNLFTYKINKLIYNKTLLNCMAPEVMQVREKQRL